MARLDRLGPAKEVAQIGSAIGREFSHALLASVARKPEAELESALDRLVQAGLLSRQGVPPHASYLFKHALVQDAAYGTLLREPRRALHARIAETLESQFSEIAKSQPEILAHHCTEAGQIEKARRDSNHWRARRWSKPRPSSLVPLSRSRPCPAHRRCVASRSSSRSRSSPQSCMSKVTPPPKPRRPRSRHAR
jgi:predicted ATPase